MNDYDAEVLDINLDTPVSRVLDIMKGLDGQHKGEYTLTNIAYRINQSERYSDWWNSDNNCNTSSQKDLSMIDHGYKEYCGKWDSDHWPVVIDFKF